MSRRLSGTLAICLAFWHSSSSSEPFSYGQSTNAAAAGLNWRMPSVLPKETGLTVNGIIYRYTAVKKPEDTMLVHVQNLDAKGNGYVFRQTDDWSGRPGNTINRVRSVDNIPIDRWGDGSIAVEGQGKVINPSMVYTYRIDHCFDAKNTPGCPGYMPKIPETKVELYNALDDSAVQAALRPTELRRTEEQRRVEARERARKEPEVVNELADASQAAALQELNKLTNLNAYYSKTIFGGIYKDALVLVDSKLPENRLGLRNNLAQQVLHTKMVDQQYER